MLTANDVKVLDINAEFVGVPPGQLMEKAGKGIADYIMSHRSFDNNSILFFCGPGNNGGDGFVAARYLSTTHQVTVVLVTSPIKTQIAQANFEKLQDQSVTVISDLTQSTSLVKKHNLIVDAMLGIGLTGELREPYSSLVTTITASHKPIIAVDVPTGLGTNHPIKPQHTVTFHDVKDNMNKQTCGTIHIVDIGIPSDAQIYVGPGDLKVYYPRPKQQSHKGENGIVLVIGGGPYTGAPALTGLAALRTGADLVYIATPKKSYPVVASYSPCLITTALSSDSFIPEDIDLIKPLIHKCQAVVIGPGLGNDQKTHRAIKTCIQETIAKNTPCIIDADAIQVIGANKSLLKNASAILTPHAGEFTQLTQTTLPLEEKEKITTVEQWAQRLNTPIFLKGPTDILTTGTQTKLNRVHHESMTVGGTGDVLAGILGAVVSKGVKPFHALCMGAFLNGQAGIESFKRKSYGVLPTDVIDEIPHVLQKYL